MGKNQCVPIKMHGKGKEWVGQTEYNFNIGQKEHIIIIWKTSLYEEGSVLTGNHVFEHCWKKKATEYSSRKSHVSKLPENVHMSGIMLNLRTQCFVLYSTKSKQDGSIGLENSNLRHTFDLSLKKAMWASVKFCHSCSVLHSGGRLTAIGIFCYYIQDNAGVVFLKILLTLPSTNFPTHYCFINRSTIRQPAGLLRRSMNYK